MTSITLYDELEGKLKTFLRNCESSLILEFVNSITGAKWLLQWQLLANLKKRSPSNFEKLLDHQPTEIHWILNDTNSLEYLLCSGYVKDYKWDKVIELMLAILARDPEAKGGYKHRLAAAVALTFSTAVKSLADQTVELDAMERYRSFVNWADTGKLFHHFTGLTAWQMRYVIGSWAANNELVWARENVPFNFKSPKSIGEATHSMVKYRETNYKGVSVQDGASYYDNKPVTMEVMQEVGAVCGGISKFGCAMSQAFGIPAMPVGQPGHCAFLWWKEGEWVLSNDIVGLKKSVVHDGIQWTWDKNAEFVLLMENSQQEFQEYVLSEKLRIAAKFCRKSIQLELLDAALSYSASNYSLWKDLAKICKHCDANRINETWILNAIKELDYYNEAKRNTNELLSKGAIVKVSDCHERGQNIVDGTGSEWWTSKEDGWVEIDLGGDCFVTSVRMQWWGTSVSKNYTIYATQKYGAYREVRKNRDEIESPQGYNDWSVLNGWEMKTARVKISLKDGSLDPWGFGRWFGIRQILISGKREKEFKVLFNNKPARVSRSNLGWQTEGKQAWIDLNLDKICYLEKMKIKYLHESIASSILILVSTDGNQFDAIHSKVSTDTAELINWKVIPINTVASVVRLELNSGTQDQFGIKNQFGLQNVIIHGEEIRLKDLLIRKAKRELSAWPIIENHVCTLLFETDLQFLSSMATCTASDCHERAQNITDGTQSEWWSQNQDAWVEIELQSLSKIHGVKIQWWGTSVSRDLRMFAINDKGELCKVKTTADEINTPTDYNDWSVFHGWEVETRKIRFELKNGSLDPWGMGKYFGIRQIIVTGLSSP